MQLRLLLPGVLAAPRGWTGWLTTPIPRRLGLISYGIFLWHLVLLRLLLPDSPEDDVALVAVRLRD